MPAFGVDQAYIAIDSFNSLVKKKQGHDLESDMDVVSERDIFDTSDISIFWSFLFEHSLSSEQYDQAYTALMSNPSSEEYELA